MPWFRESRISPLVRSLPDLVIIPFKDSLRLVDKARVLVDERRVLTS